MKKKMIQLESDYREQVAYTNHVLPLSICIDHFDDYYRRQWDCHWHEEFELGVLVSGQLQYTIYDNDGSSKAVTLNPGDGIFINAEVLHSAQALVPNTVINCFVLSKAMFKLSIFDIIGHCIIQPVVDSGLNQLTLTKNVPQYHDLLVAITSLCLLKDTDETYELQTLELTFRIWRLLISQCRTHRTTNKLAATDDSQAKIKTMIQYIHENYQDNIVISQLAKRSNISRSECFRIFNKVLHKTPIQFLTEYRLNMATMLLLDTRRSLGDIAISCGFNTASYFGRKFKTYYGITPKQYRLNN